jgi:hypothetical protein
MRTQLRGMIFKENLVYLGDFVKLTNALLIHQ